MIINYCESRPCQYNSVCNLIEISDTIAAGYICGCSVGVEGVNCDQLIDECSSNPCRNGANCIQPQNGLFDCECAAGFTGAVCEQDINECSSLPCATGSTCVDLVKTCF